MDDVYVYLLPFDGPIHEAVTPCADGHTIYIDSRLDREHQLRVLEHALAHIRRMDFDGEDADLIEAYTHRRENHEKRI